MNGSSYQNHENRTFERDPYLREPSGPVGQSGVFNYSSNHRSAAGAPRRERRHHSQEGGVSTPILIEEKVWFSEEIL
jgi:hypothetical protein